MSKKKNSGGSVTTYKMLDHMRLRPGMYVGNTSQYGLKNILVHACQELIDHNISEGRNITITIDGLAVVLETDFSTNIALLEHCDLVVDPPNTDNIMHLVVGIALSKNASVESSYKNGTRKMNYKNGVLQELNNKKNKSADTYTKISLELDPNFFSTASFDFFYLINPFYTKGLLNQTYTFSLNQGHQHLEFAFPKGIKTLLKSWKENGSTDIELSIEEEVGKYFYQIEVFISDRIFPKSNIISYANKQETTEHGSLIAGIYEGIKDIINAIWLSETGKETIDEERIFNRLNIVAHVDGPEINYCGNTKEKINVPEIKETAAKLVTEKFNQELQKFNNDQLMEFLNPFETDWPWKQIEEKLFKKKDEIPGT